MGHKSDYGYVLLIKIEKCFKQVFQTNTEFKMMCHLCTSANNSVIQPPVMLSLGMTAQTLILIEFNWNKIKLFNSIIFLLISLLKFSNIFFTFSPFLL